MESMVNNSDRATYRRWKLILDIERFIYENGGFFFESRRKYYRNYYRQLIMLIEAKQIIIQRNDLGEVVGVCGWIMINKKDEHQINKVTWKVPDDIKTGDNIYISFCVLNGGSVYEIRREIKQRYDRQVNEVFWYNIPSNKFVRIKNILKENENVGTKLWN